MLLHHALVYATAPAPCGVHHVVHSSGVSRKRWADAGGGAPSSQSWQTAPPPFLHTIDNLSPLPFPQEFNQEMSRVLMQEKIPI